jgi:2-polyprenyl-6-methoxyphenol hydroxylase-like FAD-dependent oxidoreductase
VYAEESMLGEDDLQPMGIRRWKLQKVLLEAVKAIGIIVVFRKKVREVQPLPSGLVELKFYDGTSRRTKLLLAADGAKSSIRTAVAGHLTKLRYTGITCLYGTASVPRETRGICLPSSGTTKCHACFYPTGPTEQCFQFHIPTSPNSKTEGGWATMLKRVGQEECRQLAKELQNDGWDQKYLKPLYHAEQAMKVPFALLRPPLKSFVYNRIVLIGDAAHPTVPYLGQGAQQGLEDSGTLALILQNLCLDSQGIFLLDRIDTALEIYNQMRVPRTAEILENAKRMGQMQQKRADNKRGYNQAKEELIRRDVFFHETMPVILPGATYNYREQVGKVLQHTPRVAVNEEEMS